MLGGGLAIAAPASAQSVGACDQYLPNCDRGDGPQGQNGNQQSPGSSESAGGADGPTVSPTQAGGAADGNGAAGSAASSGKASSAKGQSAKNGAPGAAALSSGANAGQGDAGGGDLLGTDYPVTGWVAAALAVLAALAALLVARFGWSALRRRSGTATG